MQNILARSPQLAGESEKRSKKTQKEKKTEENMISKALLCRHVRGRRLYSFPFFGRDPLFEFNTTLGAAEASPPAIHSLSAPFVLHANK